MAEFSLFWTTGTTGDGTSTYTETQLIDWLRRTFNAGGNQGVLKGYANGLVVSGVATPVSVATGAASVYGFPYENGAVVTVAIPTPSVSTRIDRIVLRADWAARTVRITRIAGVEGAGAPAMTQTPGTTYDIPLAQVSITTGGVITVTGERQWLRPNVMVPSDLEAGWIDCTNEKWTYVSPTSFTVPTDVTAKFRKGAKLRWKEGGAYKYGYVVSSTYGAPNTTVTITGGSDYSLAGGAITDTYISYVENPEGFPDWFNWEASPAGWSSFTNKKTRFKIVGKMVHATLRITGPSNATTKSATAPVMAGASPGVGASVATIVQDNTGAFVWGWAVLNDSSGTINFYTSPNSGAWTASGQADVYRALIAYEM